MTDIQHRLEGVRLDALPTLAHPRPTLNLRAALVAIDSVAVTLGWLIPLAATGLFTSTGVRFEWVAVVTTAAATLLALSLHQLYRARVCAVRAVEITGLGRSSVIGGVWALGLSHSTLVDLPLSLIVAGTATSLGLLVVGRGTFRNSIERARRTGRFTRPVVVIGSCRDAADLVHLLRTHPEHGFLPVAILGTGDDEIAELDGLPVMRCVGSPAATVQALGANGAVVISNSTETTEMNAVVRDLIDNGLHVQISTGLQGIAYSRMRPAPLAHEPLFYVEPVALAGWQLSMKRAIDVLVGAATLIVSLPLLAICALAIKIEDGGPILFKQMRVGRNGVPFRILKLRTMIPNAETLYDELAARRKGRDGPLIKLSDDPRRTRVGRVLERLSIDELPQLWNVLRGEMSLVGPRPAQAAETEAFDEELRARLCVRPGITGLWQVEARDNPSFSAYRRYDLFYLENWSVQLDLAILLATAERVVFRALAAAVPAQPARSPAASVAEARET